MGDRGCLSTRVMGYTVVEPDVEPRSVSKPWNLFPGKGSVVKLLTKCRSDLTFSAVCWCHRVVNVRSAVMVGCAVNCASPLGGSSYSLSCVSPEDCSAAPVTSYQTRPPLLATSCTETRSAPCSDCFVSCAAASGPGLVHDG